MGTATTLVPLWEHASAAAGGGGSEEVLEDSVLQHVTLEQGELAEQEGGQHGVRHGGGGGGGGLGGGGQHQQHGQAQHHGHSLQ